MAQKPSYIWQHSDWPALTFNEAAVSQRLIQARHEHGVLLGQAAAIGIAQLDQAVQEIWIDDALATAAIEGDNLDLGAVRSSVMRRLGLASAGPVSRHVEGLVEVMQDATTQLTASLDADRLCRWQSALFPGGTSGIHRIEVGRFRTNPEPMQIVGGVIGKETVYYTAPPSSKVPTEMRQFLSWFNRTDPARHNSDRVDGIVRAAVAHLWFESIHPFEDGNGRIGRAILDRALAQDSGNAARIYSLSRQLMQERKAYYKALGEAQHGNVDVTGWIFWFLHQFIQACLRSQQVISAAVVKSKFWLTNAERPLNDRQRKTIQKLLDAGPEGFTGGLSADKYANLNRVSKATATRDLADLARDGWVFATGRGKATRYWINVPEWHK